MWIRTQDKEQLLQVGNFSLARNYGGKNKFALMGIIVVNNFFGSQKILGLYKAKSEAIQELDRIQKCLVDCEQEIYQVS